MKVVRSLEVTETDNGEHENFTDEINTERNERLHEDGISLKNEESHIEESEQETDTAKKSPEQIGPE